MALLSPLLAILLTLIAGAIIFALRGIDPLHGLYVYFIEPLTHLWSLEQLIVKATPLVLIGVGLAVCYTANVWNIGAEGQLTVGAILGGMIPVLFPQWQSPLTLVPMLLLGILGGMAYGAIPALLKIRFNANEILTSLMLVYVAQYLLDWLVRGPWRDPQGLQLSQDDHFRRLAVAADADAASIHLGALFAARSPLIVLAFVMGAHAERLRDPRQRQCAARRPLRRLLARRARSCSASCCRAGLPGLPASPRWRAWWRNCSRRFRRATASRRSSSPSSAASIRSARSFAGLVLALSYIGGEAAQVSLGISDKIARVFQGILLFFILACDTLILYRFRWLKTQAQRPRRSRRSSAHGQVRSPSRSPSSPPQRPCCSPPSANSSSSAPASSISASRA